MDANAPMRESLTRLAGQADSGHDTEESAVRQVDAARRDVIDHQGDAPAR